MRILTFLTLCLLRVQMAAALQEPETCYILDALLFLYGIILTVLYCHLKIKTKKEESERAALYERLKHPEAQIYSEINMGPGGVESKKGACEGVYTGLGPVEKATYEKLNLKGMDAGITGTDQIPPSWICARRDFRRARVFTSGHARSTVH
ncbi:high affinity immunoglobulin epsilon receptor subunit gamma [Spea bombifrons]|uniref:high affinity immunoglobulin epsilon receptor subunit gamma n=1 Tax=Spea bombifrons TaxID=233779 RepID=UPI00234BDD3A|nr:high affinity immunoglobulin epsilon receptor subunit gamma [Spea bombifrons]